jgi:Recombination endonuclease VII
MLTPEQRRAYYLANRERINTRRAALHAANPEKKRARDIAWRLANLDKERARSVAKHAANPEKGNGRSAAWRAAHPERARASKTAWRVVNREKIRAWNLAYARARRGLPEPTRPCPQNCELCGGPPGKHALALDHCHGTGVFRGWLCGKCNTGLGQFKEDPVLLKKAANYLENFRATNR